MGVWGVRGSPEGNSLLTRWQDRYQPQLWSSRGAEWECLGGPAQCRFPEGSSWPQGAFAQLILRDVAANGSVNRVPLATLSAPCETELAASRIGAEMCSFLGAEHTPSMRNYLASVENASRGIPVTDDFSSQRHLEATRLLDCSPSPCPAGRQLLQLSAASRAAVPMHSVVLALLVAGMHAVNRAGGRG